jgi:hypothetical protein
MPVYACYRGDCANLAHFEESHRPVFVAKDALGRDWLCVESALSELGETFPDSVFEMMPSQVIAHRQGLSNVGSEIPQRRGIVQQSAGSWPCANLRRGLSC